MASPFDIAWSVLKGDPRLVTSIAGDPTSVESGSIQPVIAQMIDRQVQSGEIEPTDWNDYMGRTKAGSWNSSKDPRDPLYGVGGYNQDRVPLSHMMAAVGEPTQHKVDFRELRRPLSDTRVIVDEEGKTHRIVESPNVQPMLVREPHTFDGYEVVTQPPPQGSDQEKIEDSPFFDQFKTDAGDERGFRETHPTRQQLVREQRKKWLDARKAKRGKKKQIKF